MRKLKLIEHVSLDGVMQMTGDPDGPEFPYNNWSVSYRTPAGLAMVMEAHGDSFDFLLGRRTYDIWSGFWPNATKSPMADKLNAAKKYVVTHRPESLQWGPFKAVGSGVVEGIREIKKTSGPNLILSGSSTVTSLALENGLVDEMLLLVYPVLLGTGKRFFAEGTPAREFAFERTQTSPTGILVNSYKYIGPMKKS